MNGFGDITVCFWMYYNKIYEDACYFSVANDATDNELSIWKRTIYLKSNSYTMDYSFSVETWYHVCYTRDASAGKILLYVDGS